MWAHLVPELEVIVLSHNTKIHQAPKGEKGKKQSKKIEADIYMRPVVQAKGRCEVAEEGYFAVALQSQVRAQSGKMMENVVNKHEEPDVWLL